MFIAIVFIICIAAGIAYPYSINRRLKKSIQEKIKLIHNTEAQLIQMEKMASIGTLAAGIAHEINNPLSFLICNLESLKEYIKRFVEEFPPESQQRKTLFEDCLPMTEESLEGSLRIKKIVSDLRTFSRQSETVKLLTDTNSILDSTLSIVWNEIKYNITLVKDFQAKTPVWADATQLSQVFLNILLNAAQAIADKGTIAISTYEDPHHVYIKIKDTGCGIPKEVLPKIFDPFFSTKNKGSGLGLSVSYNIIKQHQGNIKVESIVGEGSTFTIELPKKESGK